jgi:molybdate transport system substrate-binding protein
LRLTGRWKALLLAGSLALVASFAVACGDDDSGAAGGDGAASALSGSLTVYAAASLTDAFAEIGEAFEAANPGVDVAFNFAGSSALRTQIEEGAPADVFASANTTHMDALVEAGLAVDPTIFVHNSLVVITPSDNPAGLATFADLKNSGLNLVLAAEEVPVGGYARDMLANADADPEFGAGFSDAVLANLVSNESNVKQVVAKVQLGEADAGVVYGSDVTPDVAPNLHTIQVPDAVNVIADYPIATLIDADNADLAQAFVEFVLSLEGQTILAKWGFSGI